MMGRTASKTAPHKIVILRALQLGDLLCAVPAFRALRSAFPRAQVTLIGLPWAKAFVQRFSHFLDDFIPFPGWPGLPEQLPEFGRVPGFLAEVQGHRFDLALQMHGAGTITNPLVELFGARRAGGFFLPGGYQPQDSFFSAYDETAPEIHTWLRLMETIGAPPQGEALEFPVTPAEQQEFESFCAQAGLETGRYAVLHPGARDPARRWPPERFVQVANRLHAQGLAVVLTGTKEEQPITEAVAANARAQVLNAAGLTNLGVLAQVIANARLLVSNDTGVSHIAAAFQTPSVILFSTSDPARWRPLNHALHRAVLNAPNAEAQVVLDQVEIVLEEAQRYA